MFVSLQDASGGSNGYVVADRPYDPSRSKPDADTVAAAAAAMAHDDPAAVLRYSAAYGNPYLRPNPAQQWLVKTKRKPDAAAGPNYHIGVARRQTLATHV